MFNLQKDIDSIEFWNGAKKGRLMIKKCNKSSKYFLYSGGNLALQKGLDYEWVEASGKGTIYSYTKSNIPGGSKYYLNKVPYIIAIVLLEEGVKIMTNIYESDEKNSVSDGGDAQLAWFKCTDSKTKIEDKENYKKELLKYCANDTKAMYDLILYFLNSKK